MSVAAPQNRGETAMRKQIAKYLSEFVPVYLETLIEENDDINILRQPLPKRYDAYDPRDMKDDEYPQIGLYFNGATDYRMTGLLPNGAIEFNATYEITLFVGVVTAQLGIARGGSPDMDYGDNHDTRETTMRQRDDLLNAVITAVQNSPSFGTADSDHPMVVDLQSMRKSTPEPFKINGEKNPRWACSGLLQLNVSFWENTSLPIIGYANEIDADIIRMQ